MSDDRMEALIREAVHHEADRAVDPATVVERLHAPARRGRGRMVIAAAGAAVAVAVAVATVVVPRMLGGGPPAAAPPAPPPRAVTVLLAGMDDAGHADSLVLARLTASGVNAVSLPRDARVSVPGHGEHRLASAYAVGRAGAQREGTGPGDAATAGARTLTATVAELTGTEIDHYALVDTAAFGALSEVVGGVEVCVRSAHHDPRSGASLRPGRQELRGADALAFLRQRYGLPNGDLDRIVRMQAFLRSLLHTVTRDGWLTGQRVEALASIVREHVRTDPELDVVGLAQRLRSLREERLAIATVPVTGGMVTLPGNGGPALGVDPAEVRTFSREFLAGEPTTRTDEAAPEGADPLPDGPVPCVT